VGLVESLLTAKIVDDATDTHSSKNKESRGQGIANIITGFFGGMGGCAMIGQSVINVKSGANSRLSTFTAGIVLMFMIIV
ncbi:SulP family inorganic anion transporter, partial [Staphylococcus epidermidis]